MHKTYIRKKFTRKNGPKGKTRQIEKSPPPRRRSTKTLKKKKK